MVNPNTHMVIVRQTDHKNDPGPDYSDFSQIHKWIIPRSY